MANEFPIQEPQSKESPLLSPTGEAIPNSGVNVCFLSVDQFSESEVSRQLAGVCALLLRMLARDFDVPRPKGVLIVPASTSERVELKIIRRD
ncbi:MAG: hypothetical protein ACFE89_04700 [Candidatus Hodarchaeota archaeon]